MFVQARNNHNSSSDIDKPIPRIAGVDYFCGAGGLTCGLQQSGIEIVAGIDNDANCAFAYETNNSSIFINKKIEDINTDKIKAFLDEPQYSLLCGCAPCQAFSSINQKASNSDHRWYLLTHFAKQIEGCLPDFVIMENVPGIQDKDVFLSFCNSLKGLGYFISYSVVNCADFGIPQKRKRLVLFASKHGIIPPLNCADSNYPAVTVRDTIGSLPKLNAGSCDTNDRLHFSSKLSEKNLKRIKASTPGGTWRSWDTELLLTCHSNDTGDGYGAVYGRMEWDKAAPTITTQFYNYGSGRFGHPEQNRALSFREGALLQTFPSDYAFFDSSHPIGRKELGRLIGNAVPVKLGKIIGDHLLRHCREINSIQQTT